jgi:hypothetical protein
MRTALAALVFLAAATLLAVPVRADDEDAWANTPITTNIWQLVSSGGLDGIRDLVRAQPDAPRLRSEDG